MPRRTATFRRHSEGSPGLKGQVVFQAGRHRGKSYTTADLDQIVANFKRFSSADPSGQRQASLHVPLVLGHEDTSEFLQREDLPAAGWISRVYRAGNQLKADFDEIPPKVARLLKNRAYRTLSAEVYDDIEDAGLPGHGKGLRRVAALGGAIPQIKTLGDIGELTDYAESPSFAPYQRTTLRCTAIKALPGGCYAVFSEVRPVKPCPKNYDEDTMDPEREEKPAEGDAPQGDERDRHLEYLGQHGYDTAAFENAPPETIAEVVRQCEAREEGEPGEEEPEEHAEDEDMDNEGGEQEYDEAVLPQSTEGLVKPEQPQPTERDMGEGKPRPKKVVMHYSELLKAVRQVMREEGKATAGAVRKYSEQAVRAAQKKAVVAEVAALVKAGKVPPVDRTGEIETLLLLDNTTVHKFSEAGKEVQATAFDRYLARLKRRPSKFAEHFGEGTKTASAANEDEQVAQIRTHHESFAESFHGSGTTADMMVAAYKSSRQRTPGLSAEQFLRGNQGS